MPPQAPWLLLPRPCTLRSAQAWLLSVPVAAHGSDAALGPLLQAPLTVEHSVRGILTVLASLSRDTSRAFLDWEGNSLPW